MMKNKKIISCAICGAETTREHNPHLPLTPEELADAAYDAWKAGAAIIHLHVRDEEGKATQDPDTFRKTIKLIRERCDVIVEVTTGGAVGMTDEERLEVVSLDPEMASLDCGTMNFGDDYILNTLPVMKKFAVAMKERGIRPTLECFDLSHVYAARMLVDEGLVDAPYHFSFVLGVPGGVRYDVETLDFMVRRIPEGADWTIIGIGGKASLQAHYGALSLGGHLRVGFEDNVYYSKGVLADSNAQLVERAVRIIKEAGFEPATPEEVRKHFKLRGYES
ncbi:3-keto-5-aminohexanoate cleavage protein [Spirochaeta isovalerica]|uniref:3-keto-5-aminohexanoate cleavage enzyme n=1 Tax=Spirochaeta isovalerica TaxID=150 RepID=A0A841R0P3_9SPIO|nr:3-keto-5-aminohexanoate cleavage protein [Spirochaeta isovalerica]MBB6478514.1 3-keto-5-aminohexanoate cleavage enzyme [Spirochaeta isovalerica]